LDCRADCVSVVQQIVHGREVDRGRVDVISTSDQVLVGSIKVATSGEGIVLSVEEACGQVFSRNKRSRVVDCAVSSCQVFSGDEDTTTSLVAGVSSVSLGLVVGSIADDDRGNDHRGCDGSSSGLVSATVLVA